jgi:hypothetical protein
MGLDRKTSKYLNLASQGSFLHISAAKGREHLLNISQATPTYEAKQKFSEEKEFHIAEHEIIPNPSQPSAVLIPGEEETPVSDFIFEFEDEYFTEFGNTSNYHTIRKP